MARTQVRDIQRQVHGKEMLEKFVRHLGSISIDLDDEELELEATFPDDPHGVGVGSYSLSRTLDLERHEAIRDAVKRLVSLCHEALERDDPDYDPHRCARCVESDCCRIERIHLSDEERVRILEWLRIPDTAANSARFFRSDDDLGGYYRQMMRHVKARGEKTGHCVFLKRRRGIMRCSIYEVRPKVCRDYDASYCTEYSKLLPLGRSLEV